ncbi:MAG: hypothetical protein IT353_19675 [Gemmatimonadaceae bacterium]|nr:hypothetical protein [Gemmatimonadaceae bacterium]
MIGTNLNRFVRLVGHLRAHACLLIPAAFLCASPLSAQSTATWSVDVSGGQTKAGATGWRALENGAFDVMVTRRQDPTRKHHLTVSAQFGSMFPSSPSLTCPIGPSGFCLPPLPAFHAAGALVGAQYHLRRLEATVRVGPAYFRGKNYGSVVVSTLGTHVQADLAMFATKHLGLTLMARRSDVPSSPRVRYRTITFGVRVQ